MKQNYGNLKYHYPVLQECCSDMEMAWVNLDVGQQPGLTVQRENENIFCSITHCSATAVPIN